MNILLFGSSGFIGKKATQLLANNHTLITPSSRDIDFTKADTLDLAKIAHLMQNVDVVINMVGMMSHDKTLMENVHHHTPYKIAKVAKSQGVRKWVNLSALGADENSEIAFVGSKGRGDNALLALNDERFRVKIARPSLVFGRGGASTELFLTLAKLPILLLPNGGNFLIQPVSVGDVAQGLVRLTTGALSEDNFPDIINFTGEKVLTLAEYLSLLRTQVLHKNPPNILSLSMPLAKLSARLLQPFSNMVSVDSLVLLENGSVADNADFSRLLGYQPRCYLTSYFSHVELSNNFNPL